MTSNNLSGDSKVTLVEAARMLAAIANDEAAIIEAFRGITHEERLKLNLAFRSLAPMLCAESRFQPVLLEEPIKIPVTSLEEGMAVQEALFKFGCGFHHGHYPLIKKACNWPRLGGLFVSPKGIITIMSSSPEDLTYFTEHPHRAVSPAVVLAATSLGDLLREPTSQTYYEHNPMTKQEVIARLRPLFQQAVVNRTGVSFILTGDERQVFGEEDLEALKVETGYRAMCSGTVT